jgi:predicted ferric reductase
MILLCTLLLFERLYTTFALGHQSLGLAIYTSMYLHTVDTPWTSNRIYVVISLGIFVLAHAEKLMAVVFRNSNLNHGRISFSSVAIVQHIKYKDDDSNAHLLMPDAIYLHVRPTRPWKFRGAQYIYLRFIDLDRRSFFERHPFYVSWWYKNSDGHDVAVCIVEKRRGLTKRLSAVHENAEKRVLIEGPYGKDLRLNSYESIVLFATGIGVAGLVSVIAEIFKNPERSPANLRQITLFWELNYVREFVRIVSLWI